jgi:hypothetical protein
VKRRRVDEARANQIKNLAGVIPGIAGRKIAVLAISVLCAAYQI